MTSIPDMSGEDVVAEIASLLDEAGADERRVVLYLLRRLVVIGQRSYGLLDLERDQRDHARELGEELADAVMYVAFKALSKQERKA